MTQRYTTLILLISALLGTTQCNVNISSTSTPTIPTLSPIPEPTTTLLPETPASTIALAGIATIETDVTYCTVDGVALKMDIYIPKKSDGMAKPVAVSVHGGSWTYGDKSSSETLPDIPELITRGYLVVTVNYRLAPQYKFPAQIEDVKCAVRYLRAHAAQYNLNPNHIGAWGCSAGGHLVALLGLTDNHDGFDGTDSYLDQSSRVQAVVPISGPMDLSLEDWSSSERSAMMNRVFGITSPQDPLIYRYSPITYVTTNDPPFMIIQAEKDSLIPLQHAQELYDKLQSVHVSSSLVIVKNAEHCFPRNAPPITPNREEISKMIGDFFDQKLR